MKIGILGSGIVGKTIAGKLASLGHEVKLGTRDPEATLARNEKDMAGGPPLRVWLEGRKEVGLVTFAEAAKHGELVVNALSGDGSLPALALAGEENLASKVLLDVSNPLDFSRGMPPRLTIANDDSLGEAIQRAFPRTKVVKTLNTVNAFLMVDPGQLAGGDHTMFVCGDDADAKTRVTQLLVEGFGWKDVIDVGDLSNARGTEMYVVLWARLFGKLGTATFNVKVARG